MKRSEETRAISSVLEGVSDPMQLLGAIDNKHLATWWCLLNRWEWPKAFGEAEPVDAPQPRRRTVLMNEIIRIIGHRECLREWNKDRMDRETFDNWYARNYQSAIWTKTPRCT